MVGHSNAEAATVAYFDEYAVEEIRETDEKLRFPKGVLSFFVGCLSRGQLNERSLVLDVGSGGGRAVPALESIGLPRYIGVDPAEGMVREARARFPTRDFRVGRAQDLPFIMAERCDAFVACSSLHHVPRANMFEALKGIRVVCRDGAVGCIDVQEGVDEYWSRSDKAKNTRGCLFVCWKKAALRPLIARAGFKVLDVRRGYQGPAPILHFVVAAQ